MRGLALLLWLGLGGCQDRRTFDERYNETQQQLENKARTLDANLAGNKAERDDAQPLAERPAKK